MNLLVGENGAGKKVVLDALRVCLLKILPRITASRSRPLPPWTSHIEIARWMGSLEEHVAGSPQTSGHLSALRDAAECFLLGCGNLRVEISAKPRLVMNKEGQTLDFFKSAMA